MHALHSPFGQLLRRWRTATGISQIDLAAQAGTTPRYVSFVETGRARPGRAVVLRLARALDLPVREQNALLLAAGLPPAYAERGLSDVEMQPVL
jgi:transcriptional regulator with XRE-family HTH domain